MKRLGLIYVDSASLSCQKMSQDSSVINSFRLTDTENFYLFLKMDLVTCRLKFFHNLVRNI